MDYKNRLTGVARTLEGMKEQVDAMPTLPTLESPAAESDVVSGKEFIDADGVKKTGTVEEVDGQVIMDEFSDFTYDGEVFAAVGLFGKDRLVRAGSVGVVFVSPEWLGDADPTDVVAGKTFTSAYGTKLTGTAQLGSSVISGEITTTASAKTLTIPEIAGAKNVLVTLSAASQVSMPIICCAVENGVLTKLMASAIASNRLSATNFVEHSTYGSLISFDSSTGAFIVGGTVLASFAAATYRYVAW